jgi:uncharacterized protein YuzE
MTISYDATADVLYIMFAECDGVECEYAERQEGLIIRVDPSSGKIYGCTITSFMRRLQREPEIVIPEVGAVPSSVLLRMAQLSAAR